MGARTDFVKAMVLGVIVGVAITTAFFQLRTTTCPPIPEPPAPSPVREHVHIEPVPELPVDAAVVAVENPRRQSLVDKLAKVGVSVAEVQLTCTNTCCELTLEDIAYDEHAPDIKAAFEITTGTPWQSRKIGTLRVIERCW
ncbi:MAG: hypothetical protein H0T65_07025 [Deltaproteobacteria bacterium]|nr:hypothetical protein [Deltaproteobacteria bacterium]